jgi:MFS family permease
VYISLRDRPAAGTVRTTRAKVAPVVLTLGFVSLLTDISSESVSAILPIYLTTVLGLSAVAYGFVDGLYQGVSALVRIAAGMASDRSDRPKWVAFLGYGLSCVARVFLLFAGGAAAISGVVAADRIGKGIRTAPRDAMISAATPTEDLGYAFGVHRTLDTIGAAVGPLMAFVILFLIPDGYHTVMVASLAAAVIGVALIALLVPDMRPSLLRGKKQLEGIDGPVPVPVAAPAPVKAPRVRWRDIGDARLRRLLVVAGVLGLLTVGDGFIYLALLDRSQFAARWFPLMYVGTNIAYLLLAIPIGRLADRIGRARVLIVGHVALLLAYVFAAVPLTGAPITIAALVMLGTFYAATDGVIAAVAGRLVAPAVRASGIASAQTVVAVARLVSSTGFGVLWYTLGPQRAMALMGVALLVVIPVAFTQVARLDTQADPA